MKKKDRQKQANRERRQEQQGGGTAAQPRDATAPAPAARRPESQAQRRVKYGANVALTVVVVVALAACAVYAAQRHVVRRDTTQASEYTLRARTLKLVRENTSSVRLVSLYTREQGESASGEQAERAQRVSDLLQNFAREGRNITAEAIDPVAEPGKVDRLIEDVGARYGSGLERYKQFLVEFDRRTSEITKAIDEETAKIAAMPEMPDANSQVAMELIRRTIDQFPDNLNDLRNGVPAELKKRSPDYKRVVQDVEKLLGEFTQNVDAVGKDFTELSGVMRREAAKLDKAAGAGGGGGGGGGGAAARAAGLKSMGEYMGQAPARLSKVTKQAAALLDQVRGLGELRQVDELRKKKLNSIVVMGEGDMMVLSSDLVWREPPKGLRPGERGDSDEDKVRFAGEQQVATAMMLLRRNVRPRVVFVRAGGVERRAPMPRGPQAQNFAVPVGGRPQQVMGPYAAVADRLREYNFEVLEVDLSGAWDRAVKDYERQRKVQAEMPMLMPDMPPLDPLPAQWTREATPDELRGAVWVVLPSPESVPGPLDRMAQMQGQPPPAVPSPLPAALRGHLNGGGSAVVLLGPQMDPLAEALDEWRVSADTQVVAVHPWLAEPRSRNEDQVAQMRRQPPMFAVSDYGGHRLTDNLKLAESLMYDVVPVAIGPPATRPAAPAASQPASQPQLDATALIPLEASAAGTWGERLKRDGNPEQFDAADGDVAGPLFGGAAVSNPAGGRLVVFGAADFATNQWVNMKDAEGKAPRLPGAGDLFWNSVFWAAKLDALIDLAPQPREVNRVDPNASATVTAAWGVGVMTVGMPLLAIVSGVMVYFARRERSPATAGGAAMG